MNEVVVPLTTMRAPRDTLARPLHDLRISVMDRCNFRCPYCMPRETFGEGYRFLPSADRLSFEVQSHDLVAIPISILYHTMRATIDAQ